MSGFIAFSGLLSLFPFLIFAATLIGIMVGSERSEPIIEALFEIAPEHVALTLAPVVEEVLGKQSSEVLTLSALFAIWVASNAVEAFRIAFDRAYAVPDPRNFFENRALAIGIVFLGAIVAALLGVSILFSPLILRFVQEVLPGAGPGGGQLPDERLRRAGLHRVPHGDAPDPARPPPQVLAALARRARHHPALGGLRLGLLALPELHARTTPSPTAPSPG